MILYHGTNESFATIDLSRSGVTIQYYFGTERAIKLLKRL